MNAIENEINVIFKLDLASLEAIIPPKAHESKTKIRRVVLSGRRVQNNLNIQIGLPLSYLST